MSTVLSRNSGSGYLSKEKHYCEKIHVPLCLSQLWKQPKFINYIHQLSIAIWIDKENMVKMHIYNGIRVIQIKGNFAICNSMDGIRVYYAKWTKTEKDKYCMISLIKWNLKTDKTETYRYKVLVLARGDGGVVGQNSRNDYCLWNG